MYVNCTCDVVTFCVIVAIMRARSQRCFLSLVSVQTSQAECAFDHDWSPPEPIWASRNRLSLDQPIVSVSFVCQLLMIASQLSRHPFLLMSSASLGSSWIVKIFDCTESSFQGFVSTLVSSLRSVFTVFKRYESSISIGMSTSSFFVSVFSVSLRLTGSSATVAVLFYVDDFVVNRFFTEGASCVSVRFSLLLEPEAPGVIVVSGGFPCISSSSVLCGLRSLACLTTAASVLISQYDSVTSVDTPRL